MADSSNSKYDYSELLMRGQITHKRQSEFDSPEAKKKLMIQCFVHLIIDLYFAIEMFYYWAFR